MRTLFNFCMTERSPEMNTDIMEAMAHTFNKQNLDEGSIARIFTVFSELFLNTTNHSKFGVGLKAQEICLKQFPINIRYREQNNIYSLFLQNFTDSLRSEELQRRSSILKRGDCRLGPASHIYQDDPKGHSGRGNGLRDIFRCADNVYYRISKPFSENHHRCVSALVKFNK